MRPGNLFRTQLRRLVHSRSFRGKSRLVNTVEGTLARLGDAPCSVEASIHGMPMTFDLGVESNRAMYYGLYEEMEVRFMLRSLRRDAVFMDVGSSVGYYTAQAAGVVGPRGSMHCFEPVPQFFDVLERSVGRSRSRIGPPIFLNNVAVSDRAAVDVMLVDSGKSRLVCGPAPETDADSASAGGDLIEVRTITLGEYLQEKSIARIDFIKMDIEGHELRALRGLEGYLASGGRPTVLTEVAWAAQTQSQKLVEDLFLYMRSFGYMAYRLRRVGLIPVPTAHHLFREMASSVNGRRVALNVAWIRGSGAEGAQPRAGV